MSVIPTTELEFEKAWIREHDVWNDNQIVLGQFSSGDLIQYQVYATDGWSESEPSPAGTIIIS
jgi:hypothetical protein